jgi:predicted PurR-regulated permease PerM
MNISPPPDHVTNLGARPKRADASKPARPDAAKVMTVFVLIVVCLYFGREVLIPVTLALLLTFLLAPPVNWFRKLFGRVLSVVLVVTLALGVLIGIGGVLVDQLRELATELPNYTATIEGKVAAIKSETLERFSHVINHAGAPNKPLAAGGAKVAQHQTGKPNPPAPGASTLTPAAVERSLPSTWELIAQYISPLMSPLATIGIVFVVAVFALLQREDLRDRLIRLLGPDDIHRTTLALDDAGRRLTRYFLTQLSVNTSFGVIIAIGLYFIGVPKPILWGVLTAILRFVPYVGSFIAAALPIALAAAIEPGWSMAAWTLAFFVGAEAITGQLVEPLIYGQTSGLSPFSVIVSAIFWSWVWGPVGLLLSTPLTLCLAVMGRHMKGLEVLDILLGDRPPLTPTESFYQRILADDADEALDQAEVLLKDMPLARYYDEVALPGMQLAAQDAELGNLTEEQQENIKNTIYELVEGLSEYQDKHRGDKKRETPAAEDAVPAVDCRAAFSVLSIAGRGPLDEPAARMLVQLFEQLGTGGRLIKYRDVSRYSVEALDVADVSMVCIAYLNISGSPAHLRYLIQRLRRRLPAATPVLVGLWPQTGIDEATREAIGADYFASSFEEVLKCCQAVRAAVSLPEVATI